MVDNEDEEDMDDQNIEDIDINAGIIEPDNNDGYYDDDAAADEDIPNNNNNVQNNNNNIWQLNQIPIRNDNNNAEINLIEGYPQFLCDNPGPNIPNIEERSPLLFFQLFITNAIIDTFVQFTNLYANNTNRTRWKDITAVELKKFFSVIIYMGINKLGRREFYFNNEYFRQPYVYEKFTYKRFTDILICLHYVEAGLHTKVEVEGMDKDEPFWRVTPFINELKNRCKMHFIPFQTICIDEQGIPFKGRHRARQYNKDKPDKRHFKVQCLNDSCSGYLVDFYLYPGATEVRPPGVSATNYPAYLLTDNPLLIGKNYILITDNWFTSEWSILQMRNRLIHQMGTMKFNKLGDAKALSIKDKDKSPRGTIKYYHNTVNNYYFISYQDNRPVNFFSSLPSFSHLAIKMTKQGGLFESPIPSITTLYIKI